VKSKTEKILQWIIKAGLFLSLFLPFIITKQTLFPYVFSKGMAFQALIQVLLPFWAALLIFWPKYRPVFHAAFGRGSVQTWQEKLKRLCQEQGAIALNWAIIGFLSALMLSTLLGADPVRSFWGTQERMTGVFTLLHFGVFYFILISVMRAKRDWLWFLRGLAIVGFINSVYIVYQNFFLDIGRPSVWFGNSGITGSFLLFFVFLIPIWVWVEASAIGKKVNKYTIIILAGILELIILTAVVVNGTRAVWVGLFISFIIGLFLIPFKFLSSVKAKRRRLYQTISLGLIMVLMILAGLILFNKLPESVYQKVYIFRRVRSIPTSLKENERIWSWTQGLKSLISPRILFGYGPENYYIAHNKPYNPQVSNLKQYSAILDFDKAHNQPLEHLVNSGIIGFLAYSLIFVIIIWMTIAKSSVIRYGFLIALLFIAYFIHLLFTFDTPTSYWLFFISLALTEFLFDPRSFSGKDQVVRHSSQDNKIKGNNRQAGLDSATVGAIILPILFVSISLLIYFTLWRSWQSSHFTAIASSVFRQKEAQVEDFIGFYDQALEKHPVFAFEVRRYLGMDVLDNIEQYKPEYKEILIYTAKQLKKNSQNDYHSQIMLGMTYNLLGSADKTYYQKALTVLEQAQELAPSRHQVYTEKFGVYLSLGDFKQARQAIDKALEVGYKPKTVNHYAGLGMIYGQTGDLEQSLEYYQKAQDLEPENVKILGSLAVLYKELGQTKKAQELAQKMLELDSTLKRQVEMFLGELRN